MKLNKSLMTALVLASFGYAGSLLAEGGNSGTGGIDVQLEDGTMLPVETFLAQPHVRKPVATICDLPAVLPNLDREQWENALNDTILRIGSKLPVMAHTLLEAFHRTNYYLLNPPADVKLVYTDDDGKVLKMTKLNGAMRLRDDAYIMEEVLQNYVEKKNQRYPLQAILTRIVHETLLPYYTKSETYDLGEAVTALMALAGHYDLNGIHPRHRLAQLTGEQAGAFLVSRGLKPLEKMGIEGEGYTPNVRWSAAVQPDFGIRMRIVGDKIRDVEKHQGVLNGKWLDKPNLEKWEAFSKAMKGHSLTGVLRITNFSFLGYIGEAMDAGEDSFHAAFYSPADWTGIPEVLKTGPVYGYVSRRWSYIVREYAASPNWKKWNPVFTRVSKLCD